MARDRGRSAEPWEEVPPELEELIRAQLGRPRDEGRPAAGQPSSVEGEAEAPVAAEAEAAVPKRRTTRKTAATAEGETAEAEPAAPRRRTTRKTAATAVEGEPAEAEAAAPKRRTTRKTAATAEGESAEG